MKICKHDHCACCVCALRWFNCKWFNCKNKYKQIVNYIDAVKVVDLLVSKGNLHPTFYFWETIIAPPPSTHTHTDCKIMAKPTLWLGWDIHVDLIKYLANQFGR